MGEDRGSRETVIVVHEHAGVLELIEQALRDHGSHILATRNPFEALEVVRLLQVDVLILARDHDDVMRDLRTFQPQLEVLYLDPPPISLRELQEAVAAALVERRKREARD